MASNNYHHDSRSQPPPANWGGKRGYSQFTENSSYEYEMKRMRECNEVDYDAFSQDTENGENVPIKIGPSPLGLKTYANEDVLSGRGGATNRHEGNIHFRELVQRHRDRYLLASKNEKPNISRTLVDIVRKRNGRFLKQNDDTGLWYEIGDDLAREKTSQALRQKGTERRKELFDEQQRQRALEHDYQMHNSNHYYPMGRSSYPMMPPPSKPSHFSFEEEHWDRGYSYPPRHGYPMHPQESNYEQQRHPRPSWDNQRSAFQSVPPHAYSNNAHRHGPSHNSSYPPYSHGEYQEHHDM